MVTVRFGLLAAALVAACVSSAETRVVVTDGIATLDVPTDISPYTMVADDATAILGAGVTEFRKTGAGTLVANASSASIATFAGTIRIKDGIYKGVVAGDFGKDGISIYVESTATEHGQLYVENGNASFNFVNRKISIAGNGPDNKGAIYFKNNQQPATINSLTLTADASVWIYSAGLNFNGTIDLQSHTLDIEPVGGYCAAQGSATVKNGGHVIFDKDKRQSTSGINFGWTYAASEGATLTMGGFVNGLPSKSMTPWPWTVHQALNFRQNASQDTPWSSTISGWITNPDTYMYGGPVTLNANVTHGNDSPGRWQITGFAGPVSGAGNITMVNPNNHNRTWFKLGSANPDWTGKIDVKRKYAVNTNGTSIAEHANGLALFADGALTQKTLELKNAELYLGGTDAVQHLPDISQEGYGRFWDSGSVTGVIGTVTKTGADALTLAGLFEITNLVISSGTLKLQDVVYATVTSKYTYANLNCAGLSETWSPDNGATWPYEAKVRSVGPVGAFYDGNNSYPFSSGWTKLQPIFAAYWTSGPGYPDETKWHDGKRNTTFRYDGYIWNRTGHDVTWGFMGCVSSSGMMYLADADDKLQLVHTSGYYSSTNAVINAYYECTLTPGPHRIRLEAWGAAGCSSGANIASQIGESGDVRTWDKTRAFCVDRNLTNVLRNKEWTKTAYQAFEPLLDGDCAGALLTTVPYTQTELVAQNRDEVVEEVRVRMPKLHHVTFAEGTTLDLGGATTNTVATLFRSVTGRPTIVNGDMEVADRWMLSGADLQAGKLTVSSGCIVFRPGSQIVIDDAGLKAHPEGLPLFAAAGGVVGTPSLVFTARPQRAKAWRLENRDGTLYLVGGKVGFVLVVR